MGPLPGRHTTDVGDDVVVLIGMRINRPRQVRRWWPVLAAMPRMIKELADAVEARVGDPAT
jgi:hypothetical protein